MANYYFRIGTGGGQCDGPNAQATAGNTKGAIVTYAGAGTVAPTSTPLTLPSGCGEETQLVPYVAATVPPGCTTCLSDMSTIYDFYANLYPKQAGSYLSYTDDVVISTALKLLAGWSFGSVKPKLAVANVYGVFSSAVTELLVPTGA